MRLAEKGLDLVAVQNSLTFVIPDNTYINAARILVVIGAMWAFIMLVMTFKRRPSYMLAGAMTFVFLTAVSEAQQVGEPFIVFQLPLRLIGIWFFVKGFFKGEHKTYVTKQKPTDAEERNGTERSHRSN